MLYVFVRLERLFKCSGLMIISARRNFTFYNADQSHFMQCAHIVMACGMHCVSHKLTNFCTYWHESVPLRQHVAMKRCDLAMKRYDLAMKPQELAIVDALIYAFISRNLSIFERWCTS